MIRGIVAVDKKSGLATESGIPWDIPKDRKHFRDKTISSSILMGYQTYIEFESPLDQRKNFVICRPGTDLRPGFIPVSEPRVFLESFDEDIWIIGGAKVFANLVDLIEEFYVTEIDFDFNCTKFLVDLNPQFILTNTSEILKENELEFRFSIYKRL